MKNNLSETNKQIIDEIKSILNESYVFNEDESPGQPLRPKQGIGNGVNKPQLNRIENSQFEDKVTQISKALMSLLSSLSPAKDAVKYKAIMGILTSVNKLFETESPQESKM